MSKLQRFRLALATGVVLSAFGVGPAAAAVEGPIKTFDCSDSSLCGYSLSVDGTVVGSGNFSIDSSGNVSLNGGEGAFFQGDGYTANISGIGGNVDPSLVFGGGSTNSGLVDKTFAFTFSVPLVPPLSAPIKTHSEMGITLTPPSAAGPAGLAQVYATSTSGHIMEAQDIGTFGGFRVAVNKGVDLFPNTSFYTAQGDLDPSTFDTKFFGQSANGMITTKGTYNLMVVNVAYGLTPGAGVGFSGKIEQMPVPEPSTYVLLAVGLVGVAFAARRRTKA